MAAQPNYDAWPDGDLRHVYQPDSSGRYCVTCMRVPTDHRHISEAYRAKLQASYERVAVTS